MPTTTKKYYRFLAFMLMVTTYLPVISRNLPFHLGSHHLWVAIWGIALLFANQLFRHRLFVYISLYGLIFSVLLINTLYDNVDDWNKKLVWDEIYMFLVATSILAYFRGTKDYQGLAWLMKWTLIFIGITSIMTIYTSIINPLYARKIIGGDINDLQDIIKYGGGSYGFAGALMVLFPIIVCYFKNKEESPYSRSLITLFGILAFIALLRMQIFANIMLTTFILIFSIFGTRNSRKSLITAFILLLILLLTIPLFHEITFYLSNQFDSESEIHRKLYDLGLFIQYGGDLGDNSFSSRVERFPVLLNAFIHSPFLGTFISNENLYDGAGAHLYWMNKITVYGLFSFIPTLLIFYFFIIDNVSKFDSRFTYYFVLSVISGLALGIIKNLTGREFWYMFFFVLPGLYYLPISKIMVTKSKKPLKIKSRL